MCARPPECNPMTIFVVVPMGIPLGQYKIQYTEYNICTELCSPILKYTQLRVQWHPHKNRCRENQNNIHFTSVFRTWESLFGDRWLCVCVCVHVCVFCLFKTCYSMVLWQTWENSHFMQVCCLRRSPWHGNTGTVPIPAHTTFFFLTKWDACVTCTNAEKARYFSRPVLINFSKVSIRSQ